MITNPSSSDSLVQVKVHEPAGTIVLNRADRRNALSRALIADLRQALDYLHREVRVRAVVLTGSGTAFCAGMDLHEMHATSQGDDPLPQWHSDAVVYRELLEAMLRFPKPIIAAVNGPAVASGAGLVLASDLVIGSPESQFGLPEPKRGLVAGMVSPLLVFRIGGGKAAELLLTGRMIDAAEAHAAGIYHELIATDKVWARANEVASECAQSAPSALQLTKKMLNETIGEHLSTLLSAGAATSATARTTAAAAEGVAAFLQKRPPQWD